MADLTQKQARFVEDKIIALRQLALHTGLLSNRKLSRAEMECYIASLSPGCAALLATLLDGALELRISRHARATRCLILDIVLPGWKGLIDARQVGIVSKRDDPRVRDWVKETIRRANGKCQQCGSPAKLHAHHKIHWADDPRGRIDPNNGIALCAQCHAMEHPEISAMLVGERSASRRVKAKVEKGGEVSKADSKAHGMHTS